MIHPKTITAHVIKEHIDNGIKGSCYSCALAKAIYAKIGFACIVRVLGSSIEIDPDEGELAIYKTSKACRQFQYDFDIGKEVEPRTFRFRLCD